MSSVRRACVDTEGRAQHAWRAFMDHSTASDDYRTMEDGCEEAQELRRAWSDLHRREGRA
jgi:hypothetical protein